MSEFSILPSYWLKVTFLNIQKFQLMFENVLLNLVLFLCIALSPIPHYEAFKTANKVEFVFRYHSALLNVTATFKF